MALALTVSASSSDHNSALVGRGTLPARAGHPIPDEFVARPSSGGPRVVTYGAGTRVMFRGREYPVTQLETGDVVAVQLGKDAHGNPHTHLISVQESIRDLDQGRNY